MQTSNAVVQDEERRCVQSAAKAKVLKFMYGLQKALEGLERHCTNVMEDMDFWRCATDIQGGVQARLASSQKKDNRTCKRLANSL